MNRNLTNSAATRPGTPDDARLFAQAILGQTFGHGMERAAKFTAWHFEQKNVSKCLSQQADMPSKRLVKDREFLPNLEISEWAAQILQPPAVEARALKSSRIADRVASIRAKEFAEALLEGNWDSSKHPRAPKGRPDGGEWIKAATVGLAGRASTVDAHASPLSSSGRSYTRHDWNGTTFRREMAKTNLVDSSARLPSGDRASRPNAANGLARSSNPIRLVSAKSTGGHHWVPQSVFGDLSAQLSPFV